MARPQRRDRATRLSKLGGNPLLIRSSFGRSVCVLLAAALSIVFVVIVDSTPSRAAGPWYVQLGGNDTANCLTPVTPCATVQAAVGKASSGDTVYVALGTYTSTASEVVTIDRSLSVSGGWDNSFSSQSGKSIIDAQNVRRGINIDGPFTVTLDHLSIINGTRVCILSAL